MKKYLVKHFAAAFMILLFSVKAFGQVQGAINSGELQIALQKLNVLGSVLYFAAHPDDENTSVLAYLSKGRKYRTAYLSLTRGDGGQNLIGSEKGAEIGILRTQELLEGRRIDNAEQFFSRAIDFGYSKSSEETFEFWGREEILADAVWVIRKFRPDVIITRFPADIPMSHGHHTAASILAKEAFAAAADPDRFPEQLKHVRPWQAKRIFWNNWNPDSSQDKNLVKVDIGEYDPLLGKSYTEISAESRSMHKSQGFGRSGRRGSRFDHFELIDGEPAETDIFDGVDTTWERVPGAQEIGTKLHEISRSFNPKDPAGSLPGLIEVYEELNKLEKSYWVKQKLSEMLQVIQSCAGLWIEAIAEDYSASPGDEVKIKTAVVNRSDFPFILEKITVGGITPNSSVNLLLKENESSNVEKTVKIPENSQITHPFWLREKSEPGIFEIPDLDLIGKAENSPSVRLKFTFRVGGSRLEYTAPLLYRWTDRVDGELYRPFEIRPKVTVNVENKICVFADNSPKEIIVKLKSHSKNVSGVVRLRDSDKWRVEPAEIPFSLINKYDEKQVTFTVFPPENPGSDELTVEAQAGGQTYNRAIVEISHPHITPQVLFPESRIKTIKLDIKSPGGKIGYIMGAGDEIPGVLDDLGYEVVLLNDDILENIELAQFDAIVTGVRAYNTRDRLKFIDQKMMRYVENGGTVVVQYNVSAGLKTNSIGPYPFTIGRDRVSDETALVDFLDPDHALLNYPNKITQKDMEDWVQERGLYFATQWDNRYEPVLSSRDRNEPDRKGGLLYTRFGKGVFIYSGYSWFRQLPAGVPGAYRLFVNLISAGKYDGN